MVSTPYAVTVGTTVDRIVDFSERRAVVVIYNNGSDTVYIGYDESLTTSNGLPIPSGMAIVLSREFGDNPTLAVYAVSNTAGQDVRILEGYGDSLSDKIEKITEALRR